MANRTTNNPTRYLDKKTSFPQKLQPFFPPFYLLPIFLLHYVNYISLGNLVGKKKKKKSTNLGKIEGCHFLTIQTHRYVYTSTSNPHFHLCLPLQKLLPLDPSVKKGTERRKPSRLQPSHVMTLTLKELHLEPVANRSRNADTASPLIAWYLSLIVSSVMNISNGGTVLKGYERYSSSSYTMAQYSSPSPN